MTRNDKKYYKEFLNYWITCFFVLHCGQKVIGVRKFGKLKKTEILKRIAFRGFIIITPEVLLWEYGTLPERTPPMQYFMSNQTIFC